MQTNPQVPETPTDRGAAYEFTVDLSSDNTHANVIRMVGNSRRVLELGPATGYMTEMLRANGCSVVGIEIDPDMALSAERFCERVIVGDLDELDLETELAGEHFDVIVAADVLEHLKDPLGVLWRLRPLLSPEGFFVVSLPNVAHAGVRLALLQGRFEYRELGLLDNTHLRFFTHDSVMKLFDQAELAVVELHRQKAPLVIDDTRVDIDAVPKEVIRALEADPEAQTYQFLIRALPMEVPGLRALQHRLQELADANDHAQRELAQALPRLRELEAALTGIVGRDTQLTASLIEAHDQVLRRDEEIQRLQEALGELQSVRDRASELDAHSERLSAQLVLRDEQIMRLRLRLERILGSPPVRIWSRIGRLPLMRSIVARRTSGYEDALRQAERSGE
jgi:O-antigen biosynthesis protein